jgi:hypothetical protein
MIAKQGPRTSVRIIQTLERFKTMQISDDLNRSNDLNNSSFAKEDAVWHVSGAAN